MLQPGAENMRAHTHTHLHTTAHLQPHVHTRIHTSHARNCTLTPIQVQTVLGWGKELGGPSWIWRLDQEDAQVS